MDLSPWNSPGQNTGVGNHFFPRGSFQPRDQTHISRIADGFFTIWATREAPYVDNDLYFERCDNRLSADSVSLFQCFKIYAKYWGIISEVRFLWEGLIRVI